MTKTLHPTEPNRSTDAVPEAVATGREMASGAASTRDSDRSSEGDEPRPNGRPLRRVLVESVALGAFCGVATVVLQRLVVGQTNMMVSIVLTVLIEVVYFKTLAKRF